ncbi:MAG: glycosyltransferase family 39 protein [Candidatus Omnitrophica bacterium]|nr:glycosyltransferase family 39 protein [Candidatus Omnitrophota bacterium]
MKKASILSLILFIGFVLRSIGLDFPSIGYHNMKENEYLSMAEEMARTKDFITKRICFYNAFDEETVTKLYPQPPLISYQALISWKLFGNNLWGPRLINVLFGLAAIVVIYLVAHLLFCEIKWALLCAFLLAIIPLAVFFSRNLQPESPAFFFMLLGNLFYLKFAASLKKNHLFYGGLFLSIAWLYKLSFLIGLLPVVLCLPFKALFKEKKELYKFVLIFLSSYAVLFISVVWLMRIGQWHFDYQSTSSRIKILEVFYSAYWKKYAGVIWWYITEENFTLPFVLLSILGTVIAFIKRKGLLNRYIIGWTLSLIPYCMMFSDYINQHNYYQMPFLTLICIATVYATLFISETVRKFIKKSIFLALVIFIIGVAISPIYTAVTRMYGKVFLGEDVAGESLKELTLDQERIFLLTHCQGQAIARYAARYTGWPSGLEDFKEKEEKFKIRYICVYPADFLENLGETPSLLSYIQDNYRIKELGLIKQGESTYKIVYLILKRGNGGMDIEKIVNSNLDKIKIRKIYRILGKTVLFFTIRVP